MRSFCKIYLPINIIPTSDLAPVYMCMLACESLFFVARAYFSKGASIWSKCFKSKAWKRKKVREKPFHICIRSRCMFCLCAAIDASNTNGKHPGQEESKNTTQQSPTCCQCPKSSEELIEEERERQIEIEFENYLHDNVYCKRWAVSVERFK